MKKKLPFSSKDFNVEELPFLDMDDVRKYCCGGYPIDLSERYMRFSDDSDGVVRFLVTKTLSRGRTLIRVRGIKSRFRNSVNRTVEILFSKTFILDTRCTCPAGRRSTGCAHAVAVLRYIIEQQTGEPSLEPSQSERLVDLIKIPSEYISDCEGDESDYDSDYQSDEEKSG